MCLSLQDFYWRRSPLFLGMKDHGMKYLKCISKVFSNHLSWSDDEFQHQKENLMKQMQKELNWQGSFFEAEEV